MIVSFSHRARGNLSARELGWLIIWTRRCASWCRSALAASPARIIAERLRGKLGQRFYVENQPGAGGIVAARSVMSSAPDGATLTPVSNGMAVSVSLFKKPPFDPLRDFAPILSLGSFDFIVATSAATLFDFVAAAKDKPGTFNIGTINVGSTQNLSAELFKTAAGIACAIIRPRGTLDIQVALPQANVNLLIDSSS